MDNNFKENLLALLEIAECGLNCNRVIVALPESDEISEEIVHCFLYAGFNLQNELEDGEHVFLSISTK